MMRGQPPRYFFLELPLLTTVNAKLLNLERGLVNDAWAEIVYRRMWSDLVRANHWQLVDELLDVRSPGPPHRD